MKEYEMEARNTRIENKYPKRKVSQLKLQY